MCAMLTHLGIHTCKTLRIAKEYFSSYLFFPPFSVKSSLAHVTVLEWNQSGHYLLVGDSAGCAEIWTMLTHLLNEWTLVASICIPNEPIQAGTFFYNGKRVNIVASI